MKKFSFFLIISLIMACSADDATTEVSTVELFVNHYQTTNVLSNLAFVVQEDDQIGSDNFWTLGTIQDFDFEPGFTYRLLATKTVIKNSGTDARTATYQLDEVLSKEAVAVGTRFNITLSTEVPGQGTVVFLQKRQDEKYHLGGEILIACQSYCGNLQAIIDQQLIAAGTFSHGVDGIYVLEELQD